MLHKHQPLWYHHKSHQEHRSQKIRCQHHMRVWQDQGGGEVQETEPYHQTEKLNTYQGAGVAERKGPKCYNCEGIGHVSSVCPNKKVQQKGTSIFAKHGCYNCRKEGHHQDRCPSPRRFCSRCCVLGHVLEECRVEKAISRQKREGGELVNPRPTREPPILDGFTNVIRKGMFRKRRLEETSRPTVASMSKGNGTSAPPPSTGPAGARPPI